MNDYLIKYKVATTAELIEPFQFNGYEFTSYEKDWWTGDAWIASKTISAKNGGEARHKFLLGLVPIIEKCSVVSQCEFRTIATTHFIYRLTNNPNQDIWIYYARSCPHVGLHFDGEEIDMLRKLELVPNSKGFFYIAEAARATTFYPRLVMLMAAVEAFAGEVTIKKRKQTDKNLLRKILGDTLFLKLFDYGTGLRHKLLHGTIKDEHLFMGLADEVYSKIRDYLGSEFSVYLSGNVVDPQRNFYGNHEVLKTFQRFKDEPVLDLGLIEEVIYSEDSGKREKKREIFIYGGAPENY